MAEGDDEKNNIDLAVAGFQVSDSVSLSENDRLGFAKSVLIWLAVICLLVFAAYIWKPESAAAKEVFEVIKIGALPLVTLVISFYFPNGSNK